MSYMSKLTDKESSELQTLETVLKWSRDIPNTNELKLRILTRIRELKIKECEAELKSREKELEHLPYSHLKESTKPLVVKMCNEEMGFYMDEIQRLRNVNLEEWVI
jgi:hypothetical protein